MEKENLHLANTTAVTVIGKNHQWVLKFMDESMVRNSIFA